MEYNKIKRTTELVAGILGLVFGIGILIASLTIAIIALNTPPFVFNFLFVCYLLLAIFSIVEIVFSAKVIKSPVQENGVLNTNTTRICLIVFSACISNIFTFVLMIIVMCLPDFVDKNKKKEKRLKFINAQPKNESVEQKINELKHLKDLGVINEVTYNKAIEKIINDLK